jgi:hypothetical protein
MVSTTITRARPARTACHPFIRLDTLRTDQLSLSDAHTAAYGARVRALLAFFTGPSAAPGSEVTGVSRRTPAHTAEMRKRMRLLELTGAPGEPIRMMRLASQLLDLASEQAFGSEHPGRRGIRRLWQGQRPVLQPSAGSPGPIPRGCSVSPLSAR